MNAKQIRRQKVVLGKRATALRDLHAMGDLTADNYAREMAKIQELRRKLRRAEKPSGSDSNADLSASEAIDERTANLPAVIPKDPETSCSATGFAKWSEEWWRHAKPSVQQRRCKAHRKTGDRCRNPALNGATVCRYHGGAAKHVKNAARARIENAADRMAKELLGMAIDPDMSPQVKLAAIRDALDRSGLKPTTSVEIGPTKGFEEILGDIEFSTVTREESRAARGYIDSPNTPTAPATGYSPAEPSHPNSADSGSDRPAAPQAAERRPRRQPQRGVRPITGEDAMRVAHVSNGLLSPDVLIDPDTHGLPPGRSARR